MAIQTTTKRREKVPAIPMHECDVCDRQTDHPVADAKHAGRVLCPRCSTAIGMLRRDPALLLRAADYVRGAALSTEDVPTLRGAVRSAEEAAVLRAIRVSRGDVGVAASFLAADAVDVRRIARRSKKVARALARLRGVRS